VRRNLVLAWLICTAIWIAIALTHEQMRVWSTIGLAGEQGSQLGSLRFWLEIVLFPPAAVLVCLLVIERLVQPRSHTDY
jgi:membrane protein implicated in regulation of membrane protease activity